MQPARNWNSDLGCLFWSGFIALLLVVTVVFSLSRLEKAVESTGIVVESLVEETMEVEQVTVESDIIGTPTPESSAYDPAIVAEGQGLFTRCAVCHNYDALGLPGLGLDLITSRFVSSLDDITLLNFIATGRPNWDPMNTTGVSMPARGTPPRSGYPALTDEEIVKIIAYLRTLRANATP